MRDNYQEQRRKNIGATNNSSGFIVDLRSAVATRAQAELGTVGRKDRPLRPQSRWWHRFKLGVSPVPAFKVSLSQSLAVQPTARLSRIGRGVKTLTERILNFFQLFKQRTTARSRSADFRSGLGVLKNFKSAGQAKSSTVNKFLFFRRSRQASLNLLKRSSVWSDFLNIQHQNFQEAIGRGPVWLRRRVKKKQPKFWSALKDNFVFNHPLWSFIVVLFLIAAPFKLLAYFQVGSFSAWENRIIGKTEQALANLWSATEAAYGQDLVQANANFQAAGLDFLAAQAELDHLGDSLLLLISWSKDPKLKLAAESKKFLAAGVAASSLGSNLILATDRLFDDTGDNLAQRLSDFLVYGQAAVKDAKSLRQQLSAIKAANLPSPYREQFLSIDDQSRLLLENLQMFVSAVQQFQEALGLSQDKRYLLVFQNNAELRASGGFLGSYALVDVRNGEIRNLEVPAGGSYDVEAGRRFLMAAPEPLWLVSPAWHFWDANWWPDWPTTARNLMWFYENSGGPSVDGVISFTPTVVEGLLAITGPIDLSAEYGLIIDSENFWETVQTVVEKDNLLLTHPDLPIYWTDSSDPISSNLPLQQELDVNIGQKPKKIIGDLMARLLEVLPERLNQDNFLTLLALFEDSLSAKHILFYFDDPVLQAAVANRNWAGEIRNQQADYLMVVNTNIAGQKTDRLMRDQVEHHSQIRPDGSIVNTVKITRTHTGQKRTVLTGVRNVNWLRVYVPAGSQLLSATGWRAPDPEYLQDKPEAGWDISPLLEAERLAAIDAVSGTKIYEENKKTVFANWLMVDPGESETVTLTYLLPFNFSDLAVDRGWREQLNAWFNPRAPSLRPYSLLVQKQPGALASDFRSSLSWPSEWVPNWHYPQDLFLNSNSWTIAQSLTGDRYFALLLEKSH